MGSWQKCSETCGEGIQYRTVSCVQKISENDNENLIDLDCPIIEKPLSIRKCKANRSCPKWMVGNWTKCSTVCGTGERRRTVTCNIELPGRDNGLVADALCSVTNKPNATMECNEGPCSGYEWAASNWGKVS